MWGTKRVTVVLPAYNEEAGIAAAVADFASCPAVDEVIVVDNNSKDETAALASRAGATVVCETNQGYGHALRRGMVEASGDYVILAEPDGTFVARDVQKLLPYADEFDLVLGTRTTRELIWQEANMGWFLRVGNVVVAKLLQVLFGGPSLSDCGCTMRLIRREALDRLRPRFTVGSSHFLPEMVILALLDGQRAIEVPINYRGRLGESKITGSWRTAVRVGLRMIRLIASYRLRAWLGRVPKRRVTGNGRPAPATGAS
jgi:glycosyltransferase involved in cell wall biosynthesis